ncbi:MAG: transcription antitermination factor NusB [Gammaproteobacteria bacterium]|jgi:N utilization substance protein B|nr:transcription antitermination factor NusB [Chromatiales bacterium]MDP6675472.1 transcription antitermination factor NusB [Gammaproteobacteria bacterium]
MTNSGGRHGARRLLLQALYQRQFTGHEIAELDEQFSGRDEFATVDGDYFRAVLNDVLSRTASLDETIDGFLDRPILQLDPIEHALLWIGVSELTSQADVPDNVIINEAVELAKEFGAQDSFRYINAVLDKAAKSLR